MLYNDAYAPLIGSKHPVALGQRGADCFPEIWDLIGPMLALVREQGQATWSLDQLVELDRNGFVEECYFTFGFSPIRDESDEIGGIFTAVADTTKPRDRRQTSPDPARARRLDGGGANAGRRVRGRGGRPA
jgi:hypothetical protein